MLWGGNVGNDGTVLYVYCDGESTNLHGWQNCIGLNTHTQEQVILGQSCERSNIRQYFKRIKFSNTGPYYSKVSLGPV